MNLTPTSLVLHKNLVAPSLTLPYPTRCGKAAPALHDTREKRRRVSDTPRQLCAQHGLELRDDFYVIAAGDFNVAVVAVERAEQYLAAFFDKLL